MLNRHSGKKYRSSVTITALVTTSVLMIIGTALINLVYFSMTSSERESENLRARWFLEGRVQEYFDGMLSGEILPRSGKFRYQEKIDNRNEIYNLDLRESQGKFYLHASMRWKGRYNTEQLVEFTRLNLFDYTLFFKGKNEVKLDQNMLVYGNIGVIGELRIDTLSDAGLYIYADSKYTPYLSYAGPKPSINPTFFNNPMADLLENALINLDFSQQRVSESSFYQSRAALKDIHFPTFDDIWKAFAPFYDQSWYITDPTFFDTLGIVNYVSSEKELVGLGTGSATRFDVFGKKFHYVYVKNNIPDWELQNINGIEYAYFSGYQNRTQFFTIERGQLALKASETAVSILLPEDAYRTYGGFYLSGEGWSFISKSETIDQLYFNTVQLTARLLPGIDFYYHPADRFIEITSDSYFRQHSQTIGIGSGNQSTFSFYNYGGRVYLYEGMNRTSEFNSVMGNLVFNSPPAPGVPIRAIINPPIMFVKKAPPADGAGIFVDKSEEAIILDLDEMQNPPENGVIMANYPLVIRGTANVPLAIINSENIYIENLNPDDNGKPVMLVSRRGVWLYRQSDKSDNKINTCIIYTPLNGLYLVSETGDFQNPPINIHGSVIFSGEYSHGAMDVEIYSKNFFYDHKILDYVKSYPLSLFPLPVEVMSVRR